MRNESRKADALKQNAKSITELDFLLGVNDETRQGALRFKLKGNDEYLSPNKEKSIPPLLSLPKLLNATERLLESKESEEDLKILFNGGPSLGGARPKASIYNNNCLSIAKFPKNDDAFDVSLWESLALSLAKKAGINVPEWHIENVLNKNILVLNRFDRLGKNRIPFISAMTMLGANDREQHSYIDVANAIINNAVNPKRDLEELWKRMVFNIVISNIDDHLRNHGFLLKDKKGWELSPAYDMNPVPRIIRPNLHELSISANSSEGLIDTAFAVKDEFRLNSEKANSIYKEVNSSVSEWEKIARALNIKKSEINMMKSAFSVTPNVFSI